MNDLKTIKTGNNTSIIYNDNEEYFCVDGAILLYFNKQNLDMLDYKDNSQGICIIDDDLKAEVLLNTHLKHFTTNGLNPDEFILILDNHPDYKDIQYQKKLTTINIENIQAIHKPKNRDFEIFPIFVENENYSHWLTGIIRFNKEGKQIGYYTFDSHMTENNDSIISINNESNIDTQILNDRDLQGKSNLCWLFTLEFMKIANTYTQFTKLYNECSVCEQIKYGSHKIQKSVFRAVEQTLKKYSPGTSLSRLATTERSIIVKGNGYGTTKQKASLNRSKSCPILQTLKKCSLTEVDTPNNQQKTTLTTLKQTKSQIINYK